MNTTPASTGAAGPAAEVFAEYLRAVERGESPDRENVLERHPDLRSDLLALFAAEDGVNSLFLHARSQGMSEPRPASGQWFADYRLLKEIGRGGMGIVYQAQTREGSYVAVKVCSGSHKTLRRIERQVKKVRAKLSAAEHVLRILDLGWRDGAFYYVTEYMEEGDLEARIQAGPVSPLEAARLMGQVAAGVQSAHDYGIIHRDLKPRNVLLRRDGTAKVADLDMSVSVPGLTSSTATTKTYLSDTGGVLGTTPRYWSPEQARHEQPRVQSDVYSLGVILYELLAGRRYVESDHILQVIAELQAKSGDGPRSVNPRVPAALDRICRKCLQKDPAKRYQRAADFASDLERYLAGKPISIPPESVFKRVVWFAVRKPWAVLLGLLPVLVLAVAWYNERRHEAKVTQGVEETNTYIAQQIAETMRGKLRLYSLAVVETAESQEFREAWKGREAQKPREGEGQYGLMAVLERKRKFYNQHQLMKAFQQRPLTENFASMYVLDKSGQMVARSPDNLPPNVRRNLPWRAYFTGAMNQAKANRSGSDGVHVSPVFHSLWDDYYKFAISVAFRSEPGLEEPDGVLVVTLATNSTEELVRYAGVGDAKTKVVACLLAPYELSEKEREQGVDVNYVVFLHPAYKHQRPGEEPAKFKLWDSYAPTTESLPELVRRNDTTVFPPNSRYADPVASKAPDFAGRGVAGFAQVGNTGMIVAVYQKYNEAVGRQVLESREQVMVIVGMTAIYLLLVGALFFFRHGRRTGVRVTAEPAPAGPR